MSLEGKLALVTGASRGIGRAIALRLAARGARVVVHYCQRQREAEDVATECGRGSFALQADFCQTGSPQQLARDFREALPGRSLDVLIHNAGLTRVAGFARTSETEFDEVMATNLRAPFFLTQQFLPQLNEGGRIVMISSVAARLSFPSECVYALSKAALEALVRQLAPECGRRSITVNAVAPGFIRSEMTPDIGDEVVWQQALGRPGEPEDVADVVEFLVGPQGGWITGQVVEASGGMS